MEREHKGIGRKTEGKLKPFHFPFFDEGRGCGKGVPLRPTPKSFGINIGK